MDSSFRVLAAARLAVDDINDLLDKCGRRMLHVDQLRDSAQSITANIREALGRRRGPERNQFFRVARSSSDESDEHLRPNVVTKRIAEKRYWRIHNRLSVVSKMLDALLRNSSSNS